MGEHDLLAAQLAQLLTGSDRAELEEILKRWKAGGATDAQRRIMDKMGEQILNLRAAIDQAPTKPSREELELALKMMLRLAADAGGGIIG